MNDPLSVFFDARLPSGLGGRWYGVYPSKVVDNQDPDGQARVRVALPWSPDGGEDHYEAWARVATLTAGPSCGSWFMPDPGDEVLISFAAGDPRHPYVIGALWNGRNAPPRSMAADNPTKVLCSRNGVKVELSDEAGQEHFSVTTPGGCTLTLQDGPSGGVSIADANGNTVQLSATGIAVQSAGRVSVQAATMELTASTLSVSAGMAQFAGVVQCATLITNAVVSPSYSPGAGNLL